MTQVDRLTKTAADGDLVQSIAALESLAREHVLRR
jgi:hypothetical protein